MDENDPKLAEKLIILGVWPLFWVIFVYQSIEIFYKYDCPVKLYNYFKNRNKVKLDKE
jgi:hypothetical protein